MGILKRLNPYQRLLKDVKDFLLPSSGDIAAAFFICSMSLVAGVILADPILAAVDWWLSWGGF